MVQVQLWVALSYKGRFVNGYRGTMKGQPTGVEPHLVECEAIVNTSSSSG